MDEPRSKSGHWLLLAVLTAAGVLCLLVYLRVRPTVIAESHSPHPAGGYIRIVEVPTSRLEDLLFRENSYDRFEYYWPGDSLWSAASFSGESDNAQRASIPWDSDSTTATVFLDGYSYFQLRERLWHSTK